MKYLLIVATLLSYQIHANECVRYFAPYLIFENLHPAEREGDYFSNYRTHWRVEVRRQHARGEAHLPTRSAHYEMPRSEILSSKTKVASESPIQLVSHSKVAQYLTSKHILITNTKTGTTYEFQSDLPIRGRFSENGSAWIMVHTELETPKLQLWRFTRVHGNLIEIALDRYIDGAIQIKNSISPVTGHEVVTLYYNALVGHKDVTMILSVDIQTGKVIFHGTWP